MEDSKKQPTAYKFDRITPAGQVLVDVLLEIRTYIHGTSPDNKAFERRRSSF